MGSMSDGRDKRSGKARPAGETRTGEHSRGRQAPAKKAAKKTTSTKKRKEGDE